MQVITSKKRTIVVYNEETGASATSEIFIWNETVANLTLLALGSSAPEILLAVIETINDLAASEAKSGASLGFYTIVGSAAFNLFIITSVCTVSIASPAYKRIGEFGKITIKLILMVGKVQ